MRSRSSLSSRTSADALLRRRFDALGLARPRRAKLTRAIAQLNRELRARDIRLSPHFWFSNEWFSPDGVPGIAIPFYLAHANLERLERRMSGFAEGGDVESLMRILRHEAGHAVDTAYRLRRRALWRKTFGAPGRHYPSSYTALPRSRDFVQHLDDWYAQSHPAEDFAETFAVWLVPGSRWRSSYRGWPALRKLEVMEQLMASIRGRKPALHTTRRIDSLARSRRTLDSHYAEMRRRRARRNYSLVSERLGAAFVTVAEAEARGRSARPEAAFLSTHRRRLLRLLDRQVALSVYSARQLLDVSVEWCREHDLQLCGTTRIAAAHADRFVLRIGRAAARGGKLRFPL